MSDPKLRTYLITLPIAGHAVVVIDAIDEKSAIEKAMEEVTIEDFEDWEVLRQFNQSNVCYCPRPWEVEVIDETLLDE